MRPLLIFFPLAVTAVFSLSPMLPTHAQSQVEMTAQAWADFDKADKELNAVYQQVLKSMDDDIARRKLIAAQKAWLTFRDAQAEVDADQARGGSLENQLRAMSETETTNARIAGLKKYLADQEGK
jgi:uncharacterized protein YecT (DUF1311 family)